MTTKNHGTVLKRVLYCTAQTCDIAFWGVISSKDALLLKLTKFQGFPIKYLSEIPLLHYGKSIRDRTIT
jgi:hypothetical protein